MPRRAARGTEPTTTRARIKPAGDPAKAMVEAIAMDIGKEVVAYIEVMYPQAIEATSSTFKLSVRNVIYNEIMAAIKTTSEGEIVARLQDRRQSRREWLAVYRKMRARGIA